MSNAPLEFKLNEDNQTIDVTKLKTSKDLSELQSELQKNEKELREKATLADAQKFLDGVPLSVDKSNLILRIGDKYLKAQDGPELEKFLTQIRNDIIAANKEIALWGDKFDVAKEDVVVSTRGELEEHKKSVKSGIPEANNTTNGTVETQDTFAALQALIDEQKTLKKTYSDSLE